MDSIMAWTAEDLIAKYVSLRDEVGRIGERHAAELKPFQEGMEVIATALTDVLNSTGGDSIKTPAGTAYRSTLTSVKMEDWPAFVSFALENGDTELLVRNANKTRVLEYMERGAMVPGVVLSTISKVNVRRS